jgi:hypothetical protein
LIGAFGALGVASLASGAGANGLSVTPTMSSTYDVIGHGYSQSTGVNGTPTISYPGSTLPVQEYQAGIAGPDSYGSYLAAMQITGSNPNVTAVAFTDGATALGDYAYVQTVTTLALTITNTSGATLNPTLQTAITPSGLGYYIADPTTASGYNASNTPPIPDINTALLTRSSATFDSFTASDPTGTNPLKTPSIAGAGFDFSIKEQNVVAPLTQVHLSASYDAGTGLNSYTVESSHFSGFNNLTNVVDNGQAFGVQWDQTNLTTALGPLASGASTTVFYNSVVTAYVNGAIDPALASSNQLLAYSCFGDPVGKGGPSTSDPTCNSDFTVNTAYDPTTGTITVAPAGTIFAPEPATWGLMLAGFGLLGAALRRRGLARAL